jgi:short subunit dehydrogenase-like uncharacterized protein
MSQKTIAVYGATGFTGRLIARRLAEQGMNFVIGGRSADRLAELASDLRDAYQVNPEYRVASLDEEASLDDFLTGVDVLINCAGPFSDCGPPVAKAAIRNRVHYLDTTGEQAYMRWLFQECHTAAVDAQVVLLSACAFEYATGDLAADLALQQAASRIVVCYAVRNMSMSHGTKKSVIRSIAEPGFTYVEGHLEKKRPAYRLFDVPFPDGSTKKGAWFPGGEPVLVPRRGGVSWVESCLVMGEGLAYAAATFSGILPAVMRAVKPLADKVVEQTSGDPYAGDRPEPDFLVIAFDPKTGAHWATLAGEDVYGTTARIAVESARRLIEKTPARLGFTSPAAIFDADEFIEAVGLEIVRLGAD